MLNDLISNIHHLMKLIVFTILVLLYICPAASFAQEKEKKTVLVLYSFSQSYPAIVQWDRSIRSVFNSQQDIEISINTEHLELSKYNDPDYIEKVVDLFHYKYADEQPDLIITVIEPAFNFILNHRNKLFPGVPIIFGGIEKASVDNIHLEPTVKGIFQGLNLAYKKNLDLALDQHPQTRNAIIISGSGKLELSWLNSARGVFEQYQNQLSIIFLKGLSINELQYEIENLPDNSLVFYFPVLEDNKGSNYVAADVLSRICELSEAPVYSFWESMLGRGIVGGYFISFQTQAQNTAKMALNVLLGNPIEKMQSVNNEDFNIIFDYQQLKRWSIPESELPDNSEIRFVEYSFWEKYIYRIMLIIAVFVILLIIIGYLLAQKKDTSQI